MADRTFLVLGGAGMVGFEVAHQVAHSLRPERVVLASLPAEQVAARRGTPAQPGAAGRRGRRGVGRPVRPRGVLPPAAREFFDDETCRRAIFDDLFGPLDAAYERSRLARLVAACRPDVVIDAVNTATAISYQDVYTAAVLAERDVKGVVRGPRGGSGTTGAQRGDPHPLPVDDATGAPRDAARPRPVRGRDPPLRQDRHHRHRRHGAQHPLHPQRGSPFGQAAHQDRGWRSPTPVCCS